MIQISEVASRARSGSRTAKGDCSTHQVVSRPGHERTAQFTDRARPYSLQNGACANSGGVTVEAVENSASLESRAGQAAAGGPLA